MKTSSNLRHGWSAGERPTADKVARACELADKGDARELAALLDALPAAATGKDDHGFTPLMHAASEGHAHVLPLLIEAGAEVDAANDEGETALHIAASCGHEECVRILLRGGADPSLRGGADSLTAAEYAARLGFSHLAFEVLPRPAGIDPSLDQPTAGRAPRTGDGAARGQAGGAPGAGEGEASTARELAYALLDHSFAGCLAAAACTNSLDLSHG